MSDDLELQHVRGSIDALVSSVEPLDDDELVRMARTASAARRPRVRRTPPVLRAAVAAVAASAAVAALAVSDLREDSGGQSGGTGTTSLVSFPEGSAIRLLTSNRQGESR